MPDTSTVWKQPLLRQIIEAEDDIVSKFQYAGNLAQFLQLHYPTQFGASRMTVTITNISIQASNIKQRLSSQDYGNALADSQKVISAMAQLGRQLLDTHISPRPNELQALIRGLSDLIQRQAAIVGLIRRAMSEARPRQYGAGRDTPGVLSVGRRR